LVYLNTSRAGDPQAGPQAPKGLGKRTRTFSETKLNFDLGFLAKQNLLRMENLTYEDMLRMSETAARGQRRIAAAGPFPPPVIPSPLINIAERFPSLVANACRDREVETEIASVSLQRTSASPSTSDRAPSGPPDSTEPTT
jgi:hypothetical protein